MPNRKPRNKSGKTTQRTNTNAKIASLEKKLARMSTSGRAPRSSNVTPAGNMLLHGANTVAGFFGAPKIFGSGAYRMTNSMFDTEAQVPVMHSESEKIVFRHREYIGDVACNGPTFTTRTYAVNPGLNSSFPFLASMAGSFQEYSFKGLVYEYRSTSATALVSGTNTAMGSVSMAMQYRSDAPGFISKLTMQNEMWATECRPSENMVLPVECDPKENYTKIQYVRNAPPRLTVILKRSILDDSLLPLQDSLLAPQTSSGNSGPRMRLSFISLRLPLVVLRPLHSISTSLEPVVPIRLVPRVARSRVTVSPPSLCPMDL